MKKETSWLKFRIVAVFAFFVFLFSVILVRAVQIQVIDGDNFLQRAKNQHVRTVDVPSSRGVIYDRNLKEFAVSIEVDSVYARPRRVKDALAASRALSKPLALKRAELRKGLSSGKNFVWLKRQVDLSEEERGLIKNYQGIGAVKESRRFYPDGSLGANLIGFAGVDSSGLEGVELHYDKYLLGAARSVRAGRDATGKLLVFEDLRGESRGMDVVLTIDRTVQYIAEKALRQAVESSGAKGGSAVVMDPYTGEVLALATLPSYDPNTFKDFTPGHWRNRPVTDTFEPGSTLKAFLLAAVLEEEVAGVNDIFYCERGKYRVADAVFHDSKKHGWLSLKNVIKYSSNIGAAKVGRELGNRRLYSYLKWFGFGQRSGIGLPGEARGSLAHYRKWSGISLETISFGQGISVTALQLVTAMSAIANGGLLMEPGIVKEIRNHDGTRVSGFNPSVVRRVVSNDTAKTVARVLSSVTEPGGTGTLASPGGGITVAGKTGTAQKPDFVDGGYRDDAYVASFLGFAPAMDPRITILVTLDEPGVRVESGDLVRFSGGEVAAPVFADIARMTLSYMGVFSELGPEDGPGRWSEDGPLKRREKPNGPDGETSPPPASHFVLASFSPEGGGVSGNGSLDLDSDPNLTPTHTLFTMVPDFTGQTMRGALRVGALRSLELDFVGSGKAVRQTPAPGTPVPQGRRVTVFLEQR